MNRTDAMKECYEDGYGESECDAYVPAPTFKNNKCKKCEILLGKRKCVDCKNKDKG